MPEAVKKLLGELNYSEIFIEKGSPTSDIGLNHDIYVDSQTCDVFKKINNVWEIKGVLGDVNINPDWDESDSEKKSYILNKPDFVTPNMLESLETDLGVQISDLETSIYQQGVIGFSYDSENRTLSLIRPNNDKEGEIVLPVCDGLSDGFIDVNTFLQVQQNKQDLQDEVLARVSKDVISSSFDESTNTLKLERSDGSTLEQVFPENGGGNMPEMLVADETTALTTSTENPEFKIFYPDP